jgi:hypothetical protein
MTLLLGLGVLLGIAAVGGTAVASEPQAEEDIWEEGPQPRYPHWYYWLTDETIDRIMKGIEQRDPNAIEDLERLRRRNLDEFKSELGRLGRQEIEEIARERLEARRQKWSADFVAWLKENYSEEESALTRLKEKDPELYIETFERLVGRYGQIFDADRSNPELGAVLKEDRALQTRRGELVSQLRRTRSDSDRATLMAELEQVVGRRYDLIVRQKQIAYEQLLRKLTELQEQINESKTEIARWQDDDVKDENVKGRMEFLTRRRGRRFRWD